jgi:DNA polymerase-3 subunit delta
MKEFNQILLDLKRRIFKPIYFLSGEEAYYIDAISDLIENTVLEESEKEFNQTIVYGKDADLVTILGFARQFPMMSDFNVVIVKEAQNLKELNKKSSAEEEEDATSNANEANSAAAQFVNYIKNPQPTTILVFCFKYKTIDKRSTVAKALQKQAVYFETPRMYDNQVPDWISNYVKEKNYLLSPKAGFLLAEFLGSDLGKIANEVNKLIIGLPLGKEITVEMVQEKIGISKDYNVFELQDAFTNKDILKANRIINHFAANEKENPAPLVLGQLYAYFSKIFKYQFLPDKSKFAAAGALGVNPYFIDGIASAAARYPSVKLKQIFSYLKEYDLKSKGVENTSVTYGELLKELVFKILH